MHQNNTKNNTKTFEERASAFREDLNKLMDKYSVKIDVQMMPGNRFAKLFAKFIKVGWKLVIKEKV
jgi:hypothetical protein